MSFPVRRLSTLGLLSASLVIAALAACPQTTTAAAPAGDDDDDTSDAGPKNLDDFTRDGSAFDSAPPTNSGEDTLLFLPSIEYSGFDGAHTFKVPIAVHGGGDDLEVTADDSSAAVITAVTLADPTGNKGKYFIIDVKKAGTLKLSAKSKGQTASARVIAADYDPARWSVGEQRYKAAVNGDPACTSCHVDGRAIDHSPTALAIVTDAEVSRIVTNGERPNHTPIGSTGCPTCSVGGQKHNWTVTDEEASGLVTYLRGLDPRGFK